MNLLALDTATEACSVALWQSSGGVHELFEIAPRGHAQRLLPMIEQLLAEAGLARRDLDAIAVGRGPGSFTGVRLAVSVAQGIALGLDRPVLTVSSLAALAQAVAADYPEALLLAAIDARMGEVYAGCYRADATGLVTVVGAEAVGPADQVALAESSDWVVVGTGWASYPDALRARIGIPRFADGARYPRAAMVAHLAAAAFARGEGIAPELALPVYLRDKVALTVAERAGSG